jgi:hypothetical protein
MENSKAVFLMDTQDILLCTRVSFLTHNSLGEPLMFLKSQGEVCMCSRLHCPSAGLNIELRLNE